MVLDIRPRSIINEWWPFSLGLSAGLIFLLLPIIGFGLEYLPGDLGDGRFIMYILEHGYRYITGVQPSYWNAPFMYPEPAIISYSENLLGTMPIYAVFRILGFDRETATQLWVIAIWILNFTSAYLFLKWLFKNRYAAVMGAIVFAFSIAIQSQMTHAQVFPRFAMPLALWAALLFSRDYRPGHFFLAMLLVVYQLYCSIYLGLLLALPIGIVLMIGYFRRYISNRRELINWNSKLLLAVVISSIPAILLMIPYIKHSAQIPERLYENVILNIPTLKTYVFSKSGSLMWPWLSDIGFELAHWYDHQLFTGAIAFLSLLAFIIYLVKVSIFGNPVIQEKKLLSAILISILFTFVFFIRVDFNSLYRYIFLIPGYHSITAVTRIINVQLLFFAMGTAWIGVMLFKRIYRWQGLAFVFLIALLIADNYVDPAHTYRFRKDLSQERLAPLIEQMKTIPPGSVISYESDEPIEMDIAYQIDAMLVGQSFGLKTVNGYTGESPGEFSRFWREMSRDSRITCLTHMGVDSNEVYVIKLEK